MDIVKRNNISIFGEETQPMVFSNGFGCDQNVWKECDLVLMDLKMPIMDGYKASKAIRNLPDAKLATLPIFALTASTFTTIQEKARKAGITGLMSKPFNPNQLHKIMQEHQMKKQQPNASFQIEYLYEYFDKDAVAVLEFIEVIIADFKEIKSTLLEAIQTKDLKKYKDEQHKTLTTLKLLKASKLQNLLRQGEAHLALTTSSSKDNIFQHLVAEFETLLNGLKKVAF